MHLGRFKYIGVLLGTTATLAFGLFTASSAGATSVTNPLRVTTLSDGMVIVPTVKILGPAPNKDGYFTVLSANGKVATVPDSLKSRVESRMKAEAVGGALSFALKDTVTGNCGSSFIELANKSNGAPLHMLTGFTVILPAVDYSWHGGVSGPSSFKYTINFGGVLALRTTWEGQHSTIANWPHGTWAGAISQTSYADLDDGDICYSGGPAVAGHL
jgi:hypothetical protein